jgi:TIR domain
MSDVFLSYATPDRRAANLIAGRLQAASFSVWWDQQLLPGEQFDEAIGAALDAASCIVVLWSNASLKSDYVRDEAERGFKRGILVPLLIEKVEQPLGFGRIEATDLSGWQGEATDSTFARICEGISKKLKRPPNQASTIQTSENRPPAAAYGQLAQSAPALVASPQFFLGRWRWDSYTGGSDLIYFPDGSFSGVIVQKIAGFGSPISVFGRWNLQPVGVDVFRLQLWFANMTTWGGTFRILDFNNVQNLESNYIASRVL